MSLKHILLACTLLGVSSSLLAQDRLYKRNGEILKVKIKEVGTRTITYKKYDNQDGPDYVVGRNQVVKIKYENGSEDELSYRPERPGPEIPSIELSDDVYGKNILSAAPFLMTNTSPTGFGFAYERVLDKHNIVSLYLPVGYSFQNNSNYNDLTGADNAGKDHMFWAYPGVKIYPTGSNRIVSYAVGALFPIGSGVETVYQSSYDPITGITKTYTTDDNIFLMGLMVTNHLNIQPSKHVYLGVEMGIGIPYINNEDHPRSDNTPYENVPLVEFSFRAGFRF